MTTLRISPDVFKSLLTTYTTDDSQTVKSQLSDQRHTSANSCRLTVGQIVARAPRRFYVNGESIFDRWARARRIEASIVDYMARIRELKNITRSVDVISWCEREAADLSRTQERASKRAWELESQPLFNQALVWGAADLERRIAQTSDREWVIWEALITARAS